MSKRATTSENNTATAAVEQPAPLAAASLLAFATAATAQGLPQRNDPYFGAAQAQLLDERAVAAAHVEHAGPRRHMVGDDLEVGAQAHATDLRNPSTTRVSLLSKGR